MSIDKYTKDPNVIEIVQGNYLKKTIDVNNDDGTDYVFTGADVLQFSARETATGEYIIAPKNLTNNTLELLPADTVNIVVSDFNTPRVFTYEIRVLAEGVAPVSVIKSLLIIHASVFTGGEA